MHFIAISFFVALKTSHSLGNYNILTKKNLKENLKYEISFWIAFLFLCLLLWCQYFKEIEIVAYYGNSNHWSYSYVSVFLFLFYFCPSSKFRQIIRIFIPLKVRLFCSKKRPPLFTNIIVRVIYFGAKILQKKRFR